VSPHLDAHTPSLQRCGKTRGPRETPKMPEILPVAWRPGRPLPPAGVAAIERAAAMLAGGGLVAIPTETVYGLAAVATDADAVARIFAAKGRPATNPLIVHLADVEAARPLVTRWPDTARLLAADHWPGPLTMVLPASLRLRFADNGLACCSQPRRRGRVDSRRRQLRPRHRVDRRRPHR
jgi:hypothetical protein